MDVRVALISPEPLPSAVVDDCCRLIGSDVSRWIDADWGHGVWLKTRIEAPQALRHRLREIATAPLDVAVVAGPLVEEPPKLLVMDVDSTLIDQEVIDELAWTAGTGPQVAEITERAMHGELDFRQALQERVETLTGQPASLVDRVLERITLTPGAQALIQAIHAAGGKVGVVSGGFAEVVTPLVRAAGIDFQSANALDIVDGRLTGRTIGPIIDRAAKQRTLLRYAGQVGCSPSQVLAIGDGANDLDMLHTAGLGVAFCAKPVAADAADAAISFRRLDAALGYVVS